MPSPPIGDGRKARQRTTAIWAALLLLSTVWTTRAESTNAPSAHPCRFAFSMDLLRQYSENDARAAMRVWVETLAKERRISADPNTRIFDSRAMVREALASDSVDALTLPTDQYWSVNGSNLFNRALFPVRGGRTTSEYLLLVHAQSRYTNVTTLAGQRLLGWRHSEMSLARPWLDILLARQEAPVAPRFFSQVTEVDKLSKVVLPVFFGQAEACLISRDGFRVMAELNPQIGKQLRSLAASGPLVPIAFYFRRGFPEAEQLQLVSELTRLQASPAGQQLLTVFQIDRLVEQPLSFLNPTLELLAEHRRLLGDEGSHSPIAGLPTTPAGEGMGQ